MKSTYCIFLLVILLFSCHEKKNEGIDSFHLDVVEAKEIVLSKDSLKSPDVIVIDEKKLIKTSLKNLSSTPTNTNIKKIGELPVLHLLNPERVTMGTAQFPLPKKFDAADSQYVAGNGEVLMVKDAFIRDQNPQNFSTFRKLQGLKHNNVQSVIQDKKGNIWAGTAGGVTKYDGRNFTHYTTKEGLIDNFVWCLYNDHLGNIWIGSSGGVTKYDGKNFTYLKPAKSGQHNSVMCITEDRNGNMWFGTFGNGIIKYDGKSYTSYTTKQGLVSDKVLVIKEDSKQNIWIGTESGISILHANSITSYSHRKGCFTNIKDITEDKKRKIWIGSEDKGVMKYDGHTFFKLTEQEGLLSNVVFSILEDQNNAIWIGTREGAVKYEDQTLTYYTVNEGLSSNNIWKIHQNRDGGLWFGTLGGLSKYEGNKFVHFTQKEGLPLHTVLAIQQMENGDLWFGTDGGGISIYDGKKISSLTTNEGLINDEVHSLFIDSKKNRWIATGNGVALFDGKTFTHFTVNEGLPDPYIWKVIEDKKGNIWIVSNGGVTKYDGNRVDEARNSTSDAKENQDLKKVNGKYVKTFSNYFQNQGLLNIDVRDVLLDKQGAIWFANFEGGLCKWDGEKMIQFTEKEGLKSNEIRVLFEDLAGNIWFGTGDYGLTKYDGNRVDALEQGDKSIQTYDLKKVNGKYIKTFTNFTEKDGLCNNVVLDILQDKDQNLWIGTRFGLSMLSHEKLDGYYRQKNEDQEKSILFKNYLYEDGFLGIGINMNSMFIAKDGTIWAGTNDKLTAFHPEQCSTKKNELNIELTSIDLFNEVIPWAKLLHNNDTILTLGNGVKVGNFKFNGVTKWYGLPKKLSLDHSNNYLTFNFTGITMNQPKFVKYKYLLEGNDDNWSALSTTSHASYGNLSPGNYVFRVKAMNSDGIWSKEFQYSFVIRPPW